MSTGSRSHHLGLSPIDVNRLLRENQTVTLPRADALRDGSRSRSAAAGLKKVLLEGLAVRYDTNELSSNDPIEDRHCEVLTQHGFLFGVFDGHGGSECAEVVSTLLPSYITLELDSLPPPSTTDQPLESSDAHQARVTAVHSAIQSAFTRLDDDITNLALDMSIWGAADGSTAQSTNLVPHIRAALAGSCALVAYLEGHDLHVACVGDSRAVVGRTRKSAGGGVEAIALSEDQTGRNPKELQRMKEDHPGEESTVIMNGRVLGRLMPTRAFGDTMYKWPAHVQKAIMRNPNLPKAFLTPPYVNARPVITHRRIDPSRDRFLVLATDGLFDELDSSSVVDVVDKFMAARGLLTPPPTPSPSPPASDWNLSDACAATSLVRNALGGQPILDATSGRVVSATARDLSPEERLARVLAIPPPHSRSFRDDVTVTVVFFDAPKTEEERRELAAQLGGSELVVAPEAGLQGVARGTVRVADAGLAAGKREPRLEALVKVLTRGAAAEGAVGGGAGGTLKSRL